MCTNPFSSQERQHFPEFSPMFNKTPSSCEKNNTFRWSIDNIARLKPTEIATDPATLVKTNGHSPRDDYDAQRAVDTFFSQKIILPSPWPVSRHQAKQTYPPGDSSSPGLTRPSSQKKVTFSPHPPATAFIRVESLVESDMRDSGTVDAGTQTMLTFPITFDLEKLVMAAYHGKATPTECLEEGEGRDVGNCSLRRKLFGQPERQDSTSPTPEQENMQLSEISLWTPNISESSNDSPFIYITEATDGGGNKDEHNPAFSSLVLKSPSGDLPDFSPICDQTSSCGAVRQLPVFSPIGTVPVTPNNKGALLTHDRSPLTTTVSPIGVLPNCPLTCRTTPTARVKESDRGSACTSTPNTAVTKRQLIASPFASPVLKHPCTSRSDIDPEPLSHDNYHAVITGEPIRTEEPSSDHDSSQELAELLSLDDLRTETFDLTNITSTSCTGFFTNLGLDDNSQAAMETQSHTHNHRSNSPMQPWAPHHPKAHSTMVNSQIKFNDPTTSNVSEQPQGISLIPTVSRSNTIGVDSGVTAPMSHSSTMGVDSGVAGSVEYNPSMNLSNSKLLGHSELVSFSDGSRKTESIVMASVDKNGGLDTFKTPTHELGTIREPNINSNIRTASGIVDSGLVFSPGTPLGVDGWSRGGMVSTPRSYHTPFAALRGAQNHLTSQSVLPSRLQVPSASSSSLLPLMNHSPGCYTLQSPGTRYNNTPRGPSPIGQLLHKTPPSRYTKFGGVAPSHVTSSSVLPDEVLRKKKALKARLQFSSGSICQKDPLKDITSMQTRVPNRPGGVPRTRTPPTNKNYSPFSHTLISPIRSSFLSNMTSTTPKSPLHRYSPLHKENIEIPWRTRT